MCSHMCDTLSYVYNLLVGLYTMNPPTVVSFPSICPRPNDLKGSGGRVVQVSRDGS